MKRSSIIISGLILIALIAGAVFAFSRRSSTSDNNANQGPLNTTATTAENNVENSGSTAQQQAEAAAVTVTYDGSGFSPNKVTVKSGDKVAIKNTSNRTLDYDSDPHPQHTDNEELNAGIVSAGASKTFTVSTKGTWGVHNHLNSTQTMTVIVE